MNVPVPLVFHVPVLVPPLIVAFKVMFELFTQIVALLPASITISGVIFTLIVSKDVWHCDGPLVDVRVNKILDNDLSLIDGMYLAFKVLVFGEKLPVPLLDQIPVVLEPVTLPLNEIESTSAQTF